MTCSMGRNTAYLDDGPKIERGIMAQTSVLMGSEPEHKRRSSIRIGRTQARHQVR
jgi:hypothetical protein